MRYYYTFFTILFVLHLLNNTLSHAIKYNAAMRCSVLQCVAVCCSKHSPMAIKQLYSVCNTLQHAATRCNTLQHAATRCKRLEHAGTCWNTLEHAGTRCKRLHETIGDFKRLQETATRCNRLQQTAKDSNRLQQTATDCKRETLNRAKSLRAWAYSRCATLC